MWHYFRIKSHIVLNVKKSSVTWHLMHCYKLGGFLLEEHAASKFSVIKEGGIMDLWITVHSIRLHWIISHGTVFFKTWIWCHLIHNMYNAHANEHIQQTFETTQKLSPEITAHLWFSLHYGKSWRKLNISVHCNGISFTLNSHSIFKFRCIYVLP